MYTSNSSGNTNEGDLEDSIVIPIGATLAKAERSMITATLKHCGGNKTRAAAVLGVSLKTLYNRLNEYRVFDGSPERTFQSTLGNPT